MTGNKGTPPDAHEQSIGMQVRTLSHMIRRHIDASTALIDAENATGIHGWIIGYIVKSAEPVYQRDLERKFSIRRSTATTMLQLMEKNELIRRETVEGDKRLKRIVLTEKALSIHKRFEEDRKKLEETMKNGLSEEELEAFFTVTEKIRQNLMSEAENASSGN